MKNKYKITLKSLVDEAVKFSKGYVKLILPKNLGVPKKLEESLQGANIDYVIRERNRYDGKYTIDLRQIEVNYS